MKINYNGTTRDMTPEEEQAYLQFQSVNKETQIEQLKQQLAEYDYIGIKIATGCATIEEYADKIAIMKNLRKQINELETK